MLVSNAEDTLPLVKVSHGVKVARSQLDDNKGNKGKQGASFPCFPSHLAKRISMLLLHPNLCSPEGLTPTGRRKAGDASSFSIRTMNAALHASEQQHGSSRGSGWV